MRAVSGLAESSLDEVADEPPPVSRRMAMGWASGASNWA